MRKQLFALYFDLKAYDDAAELGSAILLMPDITNYLSPLTLEAIFVNSVVALIESDELSDAKKFHDKFIDFRITAESRIGVSVYLSGLIGNQDEMISTAIEGLKMYETLTTEIFSQLGTSFLINQSPLIESYEVTEITKDSYFRLSNGEWYCFQKKDSLGAETIENGDEAGESKEFIGKQKDEVVNLPKLKYQNSEIKVQEILLVEGYVIRRAISSLMEAAKQGKNKHLISVEMGSSGDESDLKNITALMHDQDKEKQDFFKEHFQKSKLPVSLLALKEGGLDGALGRIQKNASAYLQINSGLHKDYVSGVSNAQKALRGSLCFIDLTSALFFAEAGILDKVVDNLPCANISSSAINVLNQLSSNVRPQENRKGVMIYMPDGKLRYIENDPDEELTRYKAFRSGINSLKRGATIFHHISQPLKHQNYIENEIPGEYCDAYIKARESDSILISDDYFYGEYNKLITKKDKPPTVTSLDLVTILFYEGKVSAYDFIRFFSLMGSYRAKFLHLSPELMFKLLLEIDNGDLIDRIYWMRFGFILSEDYGLDSKSAINFLANLFARIIVSRVFSDETAYDIFDASLSSVKGLWDLKDSSAQIINESKRIINSLSGVDEGCEQLAQLERSLKKYTKPTNQLMQKTKNLFSKIINIF